MKYALVFAVAVIIGVAGWLYFRAPNSTSAPTPTPTSTPTSTPTPSATRTPTPTPSPTPGLIINETASYIVTIQNFSFNPASVTVKRGDIVIFKNMDSTQHTVTSNTNVFDHSIAPGQQWTLETANMARGTYPFHCSIHATMHGTIIIQ